MLPFDQVSIICKESIKVGLLKGPLRGHAKTFEDTVMKYSEWRQVLRGRKFVGH